MSSVREFWVSLLGNSGCLCKGILGVSIREFWVSLLGNAGCPLWPAHHQMCTTAHSKQFRGQISHGSIQHLEELQDWPWFLMQLGLSTAVSDMERQPVIPVDGSPHLSTSREYQKDSAGPGAAVASLQHSCPNASLCWHKGTQNSAASD